jgi:hypothetical protein
LHMVSGISYTQYLIAGLFGWEDARSDEPASLQGMI